MSNGLPIIVTPIQLHAILKGHASGNESCMHHAVDFERRKNNNLINGPSQNVRLP